MTKRAKQPTGRPPPLPPKVPASDYDPSESVRTAIYDSGRVPKQQMVQQSGPLQVISMKTPADLGGTSGEQRIPGVHKVHQVKMRAISEVSRLKDAQPQNLGYLAPPRDPSEVRGRHARDYVIWGCVSLIVACAIALCVWFLGR
ncbi:MAG: hypothetical protein JWO36_993 [Myxococcales bacterium]|nr:hypothetical protein [Myxococcales bacterium]